MSSEQPSDFTYELDPDESVAVGVIEAITEVFNYELTSLDPLHSVIDPDALDTLFKPGHPDNPQVEFQYNGCDIQVMSDRITVIQSTDNGG